MQAPVRTHPYHQGSAWGLFPQDRACDLGERCTARDRCEPLVSDGMWTKRGPGIPRLWGQRRAGSRTLASKGDPRRLPPTSDPRLAIALLGGALAGSGPGTSPCIDGLSLPAWWYPSTLRVQTTGMIVGASTT